MGRSKIAIIDYGMGNLWSVANAFRYVGAECYLADSPEQVLKAETLVLPGVGSFAQAMTRLKSAGLDAAIRGAVIEKKRKILGICLGMQLFAEKGTEDGVCDGLAFMPGKVERFVGSEARTLRLPHVGFNRVEINPDSKLMAGLAPGADFYFVHSYRISPASRPGTSSLCNYSEEFVAGYECGNIFGVQFHPEKSQTNGLKLLNNFVKL
jgi:glutamine amidotransferase